MPAIGVLTPLAWLTADLVKAPQVGMALKKEPAKLHKPRVNISCEASNWPSLTLNKNMKFWTTNFPEKKLTYQKL